MKTSARPRRTRGFSLLELLAVLVIVGIVIAISAPSFRTYKQREEIASAAQRLQSDLDYARQAARTRGLPTGVVIKSSSSYEIRQGEGAHPTLLRYVDLSKEYPNAHIFIGWWDTDAGHDTTLDTAAPPVNNIANSGWSGNSQDATTTTPGQLDAGHNDLAMNGWSGGDHDCAYVFWPNGYVGSNQLPVYDNAFHLVVAPSYQSINATPGGAVGFVPVGDELAVLPPLQYSKLQALWTPTWCVVLSRTGHTTLTTTPPHMKGVTLDPTTGASPDSVVPPTAPVEPSPLPPVLVAGKPIVLMDSTDNSHVSASQEVGLQINLDPATPDDPLTYAWSVSGGTLEGNGQFTTTWQAPSTPGAYTVNVTVTTDKGLSATGSIPVVVMPREAILVSFTPPTGGAVQVYMVYPDLTSGNLSGFTQLTNQEFGADHASFSPDGSRIVFTTPAGNAWFTSPGGASQVWIANADGSDATPLAPDPGHAQWAPVWSPDGTWIAFEQANTGAADIVAAPVGGGTSLNLTAGDPGVNHYGPTWKPDSSMVYFHKDVGVTTHHLCMVPLSSSSWGRGALNATSSAPPATATVTDLSAANPAIPKGAVRPAYAPGGQVLFWNTSGGPTQGIWIMNPDGSGAAQLSTGGAFPAWGPVPAGGGSQSWIYLNGATPTIRQTTAAGATDLPLNGTGDGVTTGWGPLGVTSLGNHPWIELPALPVATPVTLPTIQPPIGAPLTN